MNREKLLQFLDIKIDEVFEKYQATNTTGTGDISPLNVLRLQKLKEELADLIIEVCEFNIDE